jgi:hypothetical protein
MARSTAVLAKVTRSARSKRTTPSLAVSRIIASSRSRTASAAANRSRSAATACSPVTSR